MMKTTERLVTMNNTMLMQVNGGCVTGPLVNPIKYLIYKIKKLLYKTQSV
jgi:hypothetical protein